METSRNKIKRYLISSGITFVSATLLAFLAAILGAIDAGTALDTQLFFSLASGAFTVGLRALLKYLVELLSTMPMSAIVQRMGSIFKK